jgi:hypothetical protein
LDSDCLLSSGCLQSFREDVRKHALQERHISSTLRGIPLACIKSHVSASLERNMHYHRSVMDHSPGFRPWNSPYCITNGSKLCHWLRIRPAFYHASQSGLCHSLPFSAISTGFQYYSRSRSTDSSPYNAVNPLKMICCEL